MKKYIFVLLIIIGAVSIVGCNNGSKKILEGLNSEQTVYGMSAVVGVEESVNSLGIVTTSSETQEADLKEIEKSTDLDLLMGLMNEDLFKTEETTPDKEEYEKLLVIKFNKKTYNFYYNETLVDYEEDDDEIEKEYKIEGIIIFDEEELKVIGTKEIETEDDESEFELEMKVYKDQENYTLIKYETEQENNEYEKEYKVKTYFDGKKTNEFKFEFEIENNELELEVEVHSFNNIIKLKIKGYNNNSEAKVKYEIIEQNNKRQGTFTVKVEINGNKVNYSYN